jgi:site-specific DNA-methyltransferase (adenine-specific)
MWGMPADWKNKLFFGDNLDVLRKDIPDECVDLIYLDPPFNSNASYNVLFKEQKTGKQSAAQITAFEDTWHWTLKESFVAYQEVVRSGHAKLSDMIQAMQKFLGENDMLAYLVMMAVRVIELHRVLKPTGSIYLHCDPKASHYLKLLLDATFGAEQFRNEIIWLRATPRGHAFTRFPSSHDVLLHYAKGTSCTWNSDQVFQRYDLGDLDEKTAGKYTLHDPDGRAYQLTSLLNPNPDRPNLTYEFLGVTRVWRWTRERMQDAYDQGLVIQPSPGSVPRFKRYLDEQRGKPIGDVWTDIPPINSQAQERMGYPTQKPETLLERIITASSNEGDVVLDPFCGCGTAVAVAERLHRKWIGIDITHLAVDLIVRRLRKIEGVCPYSIVGYPEDVAGAEALAERDKYQFQWWAVIKAGGDWSAEMKKGMDRGIDGSIVFFDDYSGQAKKVIIQVKGGLHVSVNDVRVLKSVIEREKAPIGALICLKPPTREMEREAAISGFYEPEHFRGRKFPKIQILTMEDLFAGTRIEHPELAISNVKQGEKKTKDQQPGLF